MLVHLDLYKNWALMLAHQFSTVRATGVQPDSPYKCVCKKFSQNSYLISLIEVFFYI